MPATRISADAFARLQSAHAAPAGRISPDAFNSLHVEQPTAADPGRTFTGHARELGVGIPRGVGTSAGLALQGAAALQDSWGPKYQELMRAVESADIPDGTSVDDLSARFEARADPFAKLMGAAPLARAEPANPLAALDESIRFADMPGDAKERLRVALRGRVEGRPDAMDAARAGLPEPVSERALYRAGTAVTEAAGEAFPRAPGYEESLSGTVGEGLGSLGLGVGVGLLSGPASPVTLTTLFGSMGAGEAVARAREMGASDAEVAEAARLGVLAGSTDVVPLAILLRRVPGPARRAIEATAARVGAKRVVQAAGRVGLQGLVEAVQEGGQQAIQNLIAREVHTPEQALGEGIVPAAGVGDIVGSIAGLGREGVVAIGRRRSRAARGDRARAVREVPPPSPEDEASPIPTADIHDGRETVADAMASERASQSLEAAGVVPIGQPLRLDDGSGRAVEGVVTDAETDADGAVRSVSVTIADERAGVLEIEFTPAELADRGIRFAGVPMPPSAEERATAERDATQQIRDADQEAQKRQEKIDRSADGALVLDALAGGSPIVDSVRLGEALAGMSGTPDGTKMLKVLAGTERTAQGDMVMRALAGQGPQMNAEHLGLALTGMKGSPDGDLVLGALGGLRDEQQGRRGEQRDVSATVGEGQPRRPRNEFDLEPDVRRHPDPRSTEATGGLPEGPAAPTAHRVRVRARSPTETGTAGCRRRTGCGPTSETTNRIRARARSQRSPRTARHRRRTRSRTATPASRQEGRRTLPDRAIGEDGRSRSAARRP